ncbi:hypothetical protein L4X63_00135 [Geomonas sp. Red32]|uniref:surface-adhesin E family protein n=1 Tax=Geomonas sp. Red32 TaxID=2912856 RepID=UPI00202CC509|nr:surface-adhesin E family protein [Geomonas sp. Red32]MCM0079989.1 hypothetical protein [Geomonas sp. Red32]
MNVRTIMLSMLLLMAWSGLTYGEDRWYNFAEDGDLKYYLDRKSVHPLPDNVYVFWIKSVAKDKEYYRREYNVSNLAYILTNYELDCAVSSYRVRGTIMFDKGRRELGKTLASGEPVFEPVPPESVLEMAQDEICTGEQNASGEPEEEEHGAAKAARPASPPPTLSSEDAAANPPPSISPDGGVLGASVPQPTPPAANPETALPADLPAAPAGGGQVPPAVAEGAGNEPAAVPAIPPAAPVQPPGETK